MINIVADTHTHTVACDHAYSTVMENVAQAKKLGHRFLCLTEHAPAMPGGASQIYFATLRNLPRKIGGVTLIKGVELNILDYKGTVDLPDDLAEKLEWVIASYHTPCINSGSRSDHTTGWIKIAENPHIDVIGHCGSEKYAFEHLPVLREFKQHGKIVEINAHSFSVREGSRVNCRDVAVLCAELGIPVVLSSDAHLCLDVGAVGPAAVMLEEIGFPQELILNADYDRFLSAARRVSGKELD